MRIKIFTTIFAFFLLFSRASSVTIDELKAQINNHDSTIKQLEQEISQYKQELDKTTTQANTLQNTVKALDINAKKIGTDIKVTETKINTTNLTIEKLRQEISKKVASIDESHKALAQTLRNIQYADADSFVETILADQSFSSLLGDIEALNRFQDRVREKVKELEDLKKNLESDKRVTEVKKSELVVLKTDLSTQKQSVEVTKSEKAKVLAETKNKESEYKKIIADKEAKKSALDREMALFESQLKQAINPSSFPGAQKGIIGYPVSNPVITQGFGLTEFSAANPGLYSSQGHPGIDFKGSIGTPILAAASGTVEGTGNTDTVCPGASYGKWVFIRHPNGLATVYGHLSAIKVSAGQQVTRGDTIALSGMTGYATGPHLHFTLFVGDGVKIQQFPSKSCKGIYTMPVITKSGAYLNPMLYF